jgi:hypothetical protein
MTEFHRIEVNARVEADVRGVLLVNSTAVREALDLGPDEEITDEDLVTYATEHDDLDGVELEVRDVTYWKSSTATLIARATVDPGTTSGPTEQEPS